MIGAHTNSNLTHLPESAIRCSVIGWAEGLRGSIAFYSYALDRSPDLLAPRNLPHSNSLRHSRMLFLVTFPVTECFNGAVISKIGGKSAQTAHLYIEWSFNKAACHRFEVEKCNRIETMSSFEQRLNNHSRLVVLLKLTLFLSSPLQVHHLNLKMFKWNPSKMVWSHSAGMNHSNVVGRR
jgi:hypothetical protein